MIEDRESVLQWLRLGEARTEDLSCAHWGTLAPNLRAGPRPGAYIVQNI